MEITTFGRPLMMWEKDVTAFVQRGKIPKKIMRELYKLSDEEFRQVARVCDPRFDRKYGIQAPSF